jgi:hypothetical protein
VKKVLSSIAVSLVSAAVVAGVAYVANRPETLKGIKRSANKLRQHPIVDSAFGKIDELKQSFIANDTDDQSLAA